MTEQSGDSVQVPQRWVDEVVLALDSATTIGKRSCRDGDHLLYSNHDRLLREAGEQGYSIYVREENGGPPVAEIMRRAADSGSSKQVNQ